MRTQALRRSCANVWHKWLLIKDGTKGEQVWKWIHVVAKHVKWAMGFVITDVVMLDRARVMHR
jgi:hypothetical protein